MLFLVNLFYVNLSLRPSQRLRDSRGELLPLSRTVLPPPDRLRLSHLLSSGSLFPGARDRQVDTFTATASWGHAQVPRAQGARVGAGARTFQEGVASCFLPSPSVLLTLFTLQDVRVKRLSSLSTVWATSIHIGREPACPWDLSGLCPWAQGWG